MELHKQHEEFSQFINDVSNRSGIRADVLEKDYYVTLFLHELSEMQQHGAKAYFKGGTALYKALKNPIRFSEDIDLSVDVSDLQSCTQRDKALKQVSKRYSSLELDRSKGYTYQQAIEAVYDYEPQVAAELSDELERYGTVKVEATSFNISEPTSSIEVSYMLYDFATEEQKSILKDQFDMGPFNVASLSLERIFIDKVFAAENYTRRSGDPSRAADAAKHLFDIHVMSKLPQIEQIVIDEERLYDLLDICLREEVRRRGGLDRVAPCDFMFFDEAFRNDNIIAAYPRMLNRYVYNEAYAAPFEEVEASVKQVRKRLFSNPAWFAAQPPALNERDVSDAKQEADDLARKIAIDFPDAYQSVSRKQGPHE